MRSGEAVGDEKWLVSFGALQEGCGIEKKYCRRERRLNFDRQRMQIGSVVSSELTGL